MRAWIVVMVMTAMPGSALAQNSGGPFGGLFGRTPPRTGFEITSLDFRTAVGGQLDDDLPAPSLVRDGEPTSGMTSGVNARLAFERRVERMRFNISAGSTYQQFFRAPRFGATTYDASTLFSSKVGSRFSVDASASAVRSPFYQIIPVIPSPGPLPELPVPGERYAVSTLGNDAFEGMAGFTSQYSKRSSVSFAVSRRQTRFLQQPENDFRVWGGRGTWLHRLSRDLSLRLGYGREEAHSQALGSGTFVHETIDAGVDFAREVSIARRTSLTAYTQTSMLKEPGAQRRYRLNGGASLLRGFKRTWSSSLIFNRATEFIAGFRAPLFSDSLSMAIGGLLAKRVEWTGGVGAGHSKVGFGGDGTFFTYSGTTRLSAGLTRKLGLYAQYTYYHYEIPPGSTVVDLLPAMSRQSVSAGLTAWLPIINRMRGPSDPR